MPQPQSIRPRIPEHHNGITLAGKDLKAGSAMGISTVFSPRMESGQVTFAGVLESLCPKHGMNEGPGL